MCLLAAISMKKLLLLVFVLVISGGVFLNHWSFGSAADEQALRKAVSKFSHWNIAARAAIGDIPSNASNLCNQVSNNSTAIDLAGPILGLTAAGIDPRTCDVDLIAALKQKVHNNQMGDPNLVNDDIFGGLALLSAGESVSSSAVQAAVFTVKNNQNQNGSFGFRLGDSDDVDITAAAVAFLRAAGQSTQLAELFLKNKQNTDGGFPAYGQTTSNPYSASWVAAFAGGMSWSNGGSTLEAYLESVDGVQSAAFRLIALSGKQIPVQTISPTIPPVITQAPSASSSSTAQSQLVAYNIVSSRFSLCRGEVSAATALEVAEKAAAACTLSIDIVDDSLGRYVRAIGGHEPAGTSGWMYALNGTKPLVSAEVQAVSSGDKIIWFYGSVDASAPEFVLDGTVSESSVTIPLSASIRIPVSTQIDTPPQQNPPGGNANTTDRQEASINVKSSAVNFGTLQPGQSANAPMVVENNGEVALTIGSEVSGDSLFTQNIDINNVYWADFTDTLEIQEDKNVDVMLSVPGGYNQSGAHQGTITIWGRSR